MPIAFAVPCLNHNVLVFLRQISNFEPENVEYLCFTANCEYIEAPSGSKEIFNKKRIVQF